MYRRAKVNVKRQRAKGKSEAASEFATLRPVRAAGFPQQYLPDSCKKKVKGENSPRALLHFYPLPF
jgi:hypothetical protein